jgi:flagellar biosynthesis protein FlhF
MKIKRYQARDMRSALRQIRLELGADAVILSTQSIDGGVEICAADDTDPAGAHNTAALPAPMPAPLQGMAAERTPLPATMLAAVTGTATTSIAPAPDVEQGAMSAELRSLRELLERQLTTLAWNDFTRRDPIRARALNELMDLGMPRDDAWQLLQTVPAEALEAVGSHAHHDALAAALRTVELEPLLQRAVALIGPPGAGKSTLLAKLAVRAVVEHGAAQVAIVTLDTQRLGAGDQTRAIGRLLGVDTSIASSAEELLALQARWSGRRLVLIDTAGALPRDSVALLALQKQFARLTELCTLLVLPASAQPELLQCCLERFGAFKPAATVLTRVDEALSLGGALAALLRHGIPLAALSDGPRVPEDLLPARSAELVTRALTLHADNNNRGAAHAAA